MAENNATAAEEKSLQRSLYEWVESAVFALLCVTLLFTFVFRVVGVSGRSMLNTLHSGDRLIVFNTGYTPARGDIVIVRRDDEEPIVKRVIGVAGDVISIDTETEKVFLNGEELDEPYLDCTTPTLYGFTGPYTVPEDTIFVMGDNRPESHDSRAPDISAVHLDHVMGKAVFRILPLSSFGKIE